MININDLLYKEDFETINNIYKFSLHLKNKNILVTGSTGLVGSCLIDFLMYLNKYNNSNIKVIAVGRNKSKLEKRFEAYINNNNFKMIIQDVCEPLNTEEEINYIIHAASNADPKSFSNDPVGTMNANLIGTTNLLKYAKDKKCRLLYISSTEIYGTTESNDNGITESDYGIIDCNSLRACYPESKRAAETLCHCYSEQYNIDTVIARLCYIYGPTMTESDSRVIAQFTRKVLNKENIVMKSEGLQKRSYCYVTDAVAAILYTILNGNVRNAYNISNDKSNVTIKEIAEIMALQFNLDVVLEIPDTMESRGYSKQGDIVVNSDKLNKLGWSAQFTMDKGIKRTIDIMLSRA